MKIRKLSVVVVTLLSVILLAPSAFAASGADFSTLTASVDFSSAIAALLVVFAAAAGLGIVWAGGTLIVRKVFGGGK